MKRRFIYNYSFNVEAVSNNKAEAVINQLGQSAYAMEMQPAPVDHPLYGQLFMISKPNDYKAVKITKDTELISDYYQQKGILLTFDGRVVYTITELYTDEKGHVFLQLTRKTEA